MWASTLLILLTLATWLIHDHTTAIRRHGRRLKRPPGTLPLAGYGLWFLQPRHVLLDWFASIQPLMGFETYELPVPSLPPAVLVNSPAVLEQILKDTTTFVKGGFFRSRSEDLFRDGILNVDGGLWRAQRKAGVRFLSAGNVEGFVDGVLPGMIDDLVARLDDAAGSEGEGVVDLQELLVALTTRFMGRIAYDMDITHDMPFARAFEYASAETGYRFTNPLWKVKDFFLGAAFRGAVAEIHAFGAEIVDATRRRERGGESARAGRDGDGGGHGLKMNLISSLMKHISSTETVAAAAMNYLSAGRDTTGQSLAWTFYHLIRNPTTMARLRRSLEPAHRRDTSFSYKEIKTDRRMAYLHAVFAESLRVSPPIPLEIKETTRAVVLEDGTSLPSGAVVVWSPYASARNTKIWGRDAAEFRAERWLKGVHETVSYKFQAGDEQEKRHEIDLSGAEFLPNLKTPFEFPVFNAGPRACIGKHLAEVLAAVVISRLVLAFEFETTDPGGPLRWRKVGQDGLTMSIKNGLSVKVRRRGKQ